MASGTLNIKLEIANRDQFIKGLQAKIQDATSEALTSGFKEGWKRSADAMQDTLRRQPLKITFDERKLQQDATRVADQLREAAKFSVRVDFTEARRGYANFTQEMARFREYSREMDVTARKESLTRLDDMRKEQKKKFADAREAAKALLTSASTDERKKGRDIMSSLSKMEKESTRSLFKLTKQLDETGEEFGELKEDFMQTRSASEKLWDSVSDKGKGVWDAMNSKTMSWVKGLAAAYISYAAIRTAIFKLIDLQDQLAEKTAATGVSYTKAWQYVEQASAITLDYGEAIGIVGDLAQYGEEAFEALAPLTEQFAKLKVLGQDLGPLTEYFAAMGRSYGSDVVPMIKDFTNTLYNIENRVLRDKAMQTLVEQVQMLGTAGPQWLASASRGIVRTTKALEQMGVRTGVISNFMQAISDFNPFEDQGDAWSQSFKMYLSLEEEAKLTIGGESGYQMGMTAMRRMLQQNILEFQGSEQQVKLNMKILEKRHGKDIVEMLVKLNRGEEGWDQELKQQYVGGVDEQKLEKEFDKRNSTTARSLKGLKHMWESILMRLGDAFLPVVKTFSERLQTWINSPAFDKFVASVESLVDVIVDKTIPLGIGMSKTLAQWLRTLDKITGGEDDGSAITGGLKLFGASLASKTLTGKGLTQNLFSAGKWVAKKLPKAGKMILGGGKLGKFVKGGPLTTILAAFEWATEGIKIGRLSEELYGKELVEKYGVVASKAGTSISGFLGGAVKGLYSTAGLIGKTILWGLNKLGLDFKVNWSEKIDEFGESIDMAFAGFSETLTEFFSIWTEFDLIGTAKTIGSLGLSSLKEKAESVGYYVNKSLFFIVNGIVDGVLGLVVSLGKQVADWVCDITGGRIDFTGEFASAESWIEGLKMEIPEPPKSQGQKIEKRIAEIKAQGAASQGEGGSITSAVAEGTSQLIEQAANAVTESVEGDLPGLRIAVAESTEDLQGSIREMYNGKVWDTIRYAFDESVVSKLPGFNEAVTDSSAALFTLVQETFDSIFTKGYEEIDRLKSAATSYTSDGGTQTRTEEGGASNTSPTITGGTVSPQTGTTSNALTAGTRPGALSTQFINWLHVTHPQEYDTYHQQFLHSVETTAPRDQSLGVAPQITPAPAGQPLSAISPELSMAEELQRGTPEERLLARAVIYLGGIFTNTQKQAGTLGNIAQNESYQRLMRHVEYDIERLGTLQ